MTPDDIRNLANQWTDAEDYNMPSWEYTATVLRALSDVVEAAQGEYWKSRCRLAVEVLGAYRLLPNAQAVLEAIGRLPPEQSRD